MTQADRATLWEVGVTQKIGVLLPQTGHLPECCLVLLVGKCPGA